MTGINPTKGLKIKMKEAAQDQRKAFTNFEVHEVLHDLVECARESSDARYWLPIMMAYTGARPEELAQLRVKDVRTVYEGDDTGYLVFDLRGETDGQRIKTESSRRLVPVAQKLMDWGLHRLYSGRDGDEMLFPALNAGVSGRFAEAPSRWFNARLRREGIVDSKLTLYSFRHSVATELKRQGIGDTTISEILGHSVSGQTSRYAKHFELETLADALAQLDWCL
jgi:integrase